MVYVRAGEDGEKFVSHALAHYAASKKKKNERYNVVMSGLPNRVTVGTSFRVIWSWSKSVN